MYTKEIELDENNKHIATRIYELDQNGKVLNVKLIFEHDEFADLPFGGSDNDWPNGFSDNVAFKDAEFIDGEYVFKRKGTSHYTVSPNDFEICNKTYFNEKGQIIRIEEHGNNESFIQTFTYDEDGLLIKENIDNFISMFNYIERIYVYANQYNDRLNRAVKQLKYSKFDDSFEVFYSYTRFGDLAGIFPVDIEAESLIAEQQFLYTYEKNGNWESKRHFENGELISSFQRAYGDFSEYFNEVTDENDSDEFELPF
jgi:hypothetical protein